MSTETRSRLSIREIRDDELERFVEAASSAFFMWPWDPAAAAAYRRATTGPARSLAAFEGDRIVGTYRSFATDLTLPGGAPAPVGAVTAVTVRPTHRRRGILTDLVERDLRDSIERGEVANILVSAEYPIYGRFGFGPATDHADYSIRARHLRLRGEPTGSVEIVDATTGRELIPPIFDRHRSTQAGEISRPAWRFDSELGLVPAPPRPPWKGQIAIHRDADGEPDAYVRYRGEEHWDEGIPDNALIVDELHGATRAAELEMWRYLASIDLVATITASGRRVDEPFRWAAVDARAVRLTHVQDMLWLRPLDLGRLLGARRYDREGRIVLEVVDRLRDGSDGPCAGRWQLEATPDGATCARTGAEPDLTVPIAALGAACLGGPRLAHVILGTGADEHTPGAVARAELLLRTADAPWCTTYF